MDYLDLVALRLERSLGTLLPRLSSKSTGLNCCSGLASALVTAGDVAFSLVRLGMFFFGPAINSYFLLGLIHLRLSRPNRQFALTYGHN